MSIPVLDFQKPVVGEDFSPLSELVGASPVMDGNVIKMKGDYFGNIGWGKQKYPDGDPLVIDGQNETTVHGSLVVMDCHNVIVKNMVIEGFIELNDSYPEIGLRNVTLQNVFVCKGHPRGIFMGGHNIEGITLRNVTVLYTIFGTHCVYLTGGHWREDYPAVRDVVIEHCDFGYSPGGRNVLQFNGRFDGVKVRKTRFRHGQIGGCTFIGVQNGVFEENVSYGHNRGEGFQSYVYASHWAPYYNNFATQEDIDHFCMTHWPNQNLTIRNNTFVVGPHQFSYDDWHYDDPTKGHPAFLVNNAVHEDFFPFPSKNILFFNNILWSPTERLIDVYTKHDAQNLAIVGNMGFTPSKKIPTINFSKDLAEFSGNIFKDPYFQHGPVYPASIKLEDGYDWMNHKSVFNPFSYYGWKNGKGVSFRMPVLGAKSGQEMDTGSDQATRSFYQEGKSGGDVGVGLRGEGA